MYQVLLVDDEKYISKGLESGIDWESLNVDTIYTAQNAEAALGIIREDPMWLLRISGCPV